jgi:hypothetical protein
MIKDIIKFFGIIYLATIAIEIFILRLVVGLPLSVDVWKGILLGSLVIVVIIIVSFILEEVFL